MKILYVITQAEAGGAQKYVLELAQALGGEIVTGSEPGGLTMLAEDAGLTVHKLYHLKRAINPVDDLLAFFDLLNLVKRIQPDIIHLNSSKAGVLGSFLKPFTKAKIIYTAHGFVFNEPLPAWRKQFYILAERWASRYRDYIIAVSQKDLDSALEQHIAPRDQLTVVHNGIPEINFLNKTSARQYLGLPLEDKIVIGTVANFYEAKGVDVLIEAVAKIDKNKLPNLLFAVIGEGRERQKYERLISHYQLDDYIKLLGHRELASHYLKAFDVFVLPSRKEGFPFAILEAMQAGLPIVATSVGGVPEAVGDVAVLVEPNRPELLARALENLLNKEAAIKLQTLSQKSLERAKQFTAENMIEQTKRIYTFLLSKV